MPWRLLGALLLVAALVAGIVGVYLAVSGGDEGEGPLAGGEKQETVAAASPTVKATLKPTVSPKSTPTPALIATPTEETQPPAVSQEAQVKAIAVWIEQSGEQYAGDCATTNVETDVGKYCSQLWEDRGDSAIYALGFAFSEYGIWLLLELVDGDWVVTDWADMVEEEMVPPW
jgi:hypothetical protein